MASEEGVVTAVGPATAWVKTTRSSACKSCSARHSCSPQDNNETLVEVVNPIKAKVGDRILLTIESAALLKAAFLIYVFPILGMLVGAGLGQWGGTALGLNPSWSAPILAALFFLVAFALMKSKGNRMARTDAYKPKIVRVITPAPPVNNATHP